MNKKFKQLHIKLNPKSIRLESSCTPNLYPSIQNFLVMLMLTELELEL